MKRIILPLLLIASINSLSQTTECEQVLNQANAEYEAGRFSTLPALLKPCLDNGFSNEQKVRAYLLLTQIYLTLDDPIAAENSYLQLLKANPEFVANPARDPIDVYYLSKKFTTTPKFTPNFFVGGNTSFQRVIHTVNTSPDMTLVATKKPMKAGYQVGGNFDWNVTDRWSVALGLDYSFKSISTIYTDANAQTRRGEDIEKQNWIDIPLYIKYADDSGRFRPFGYLGIAANFLLDAKLSTSEVFYNPSDPAAQEVSQGADQPINYNRKFFNGSLVVGAGFKYKIGKNFLFVDARYMAGINNIAKNIYLNSSGQINPLVTSSQYTSNLYRIDNLSLSVGFIKPLYDPRKRKPITGLLQKIGFKKAKK